MMENLQRQSKEVLWKKMAAEIFLSRVNELTQ